MESVNTKHLEFIQLAINRYAWQSVAIKVLLVASTLVGLTLTGESVATAIQPGVVAIVLVFSLWLIDGHYHDMQRRYVQRYDEAVRSTETDWAMTVPAAGRIDVSALWRPSVAILPIASIALLALLTLT